MKHVATALLLIGLAPLGLWLAGGFAEDVARVALGLVVVGALVLRKQLELAELPRWSSWLFLGCAATMVPVFLVHGWTRVLAGRMGVDFALFTQCVHSIATTGVPTTSLLGDAPVNFLTHHFAPILYLPGALAAVGVRAPLALLLAQAIAFAFVLAGVYAGARGLGLQAPVAAAWTLIVSVCPNLRPELLWGVHDEVLSLPFAVWAIVALIRRRPVLSMVLMVASASGKESFFAIGPLWLVVLVLWGGSTRRQLLIAALLAFAGVAAGAFYVWGQPLWAGKTFDHLGRVGAEPSTIFPTFGARVSFAVSFLLWLGFLPLFSRRARLLAVSALPFIGLGLVASDTELYRFGGYHSIVPQSLLALAGAAGLADLRPNLRRWTPIVLAALICAQLSWNARGLWRPAREASTAQWYPAPELARLPKDVVIAADPAAALALLDHRVVRVFTAEEQRLSVEVVVARPDGWEPPGPFLMENARACPGFGSWITLCREPR